MPMSISAGGLGQLEGLLALERTWVKKADVHGMDEVHAVALPRTESWQRESMQADMYTCMGVESLQGPSGIWLEKKSTSK
jgi:hypothetical protein